MWNEKSSVSPISAIGDATAMTRSAIPSAKSAILQPGTGWPRRVSVRARTVYATAMSDDRRELKRRERPARQQGRLVHPTDCTLGPWAGSRRTRPPASRSRRRTRSSSGCARPSSRRERRGFGAFAGLYPLDGERLLAASTDSVGTKLILARERGALRACGADLAAHCINDVITTGADPLFFLDYVAANRIELETVAELVEGAAEVCRDAGVRARRRRDGGASRHLPRGRARLRGDVRRDGRERCADRRFGRRRGRRRRRPAVGRCPRERLHARPARARGRGLHRSRLARPDEALSRRRATPARPLPLRSRT